jgi:hypothetical protein
VKAVPVEVSLTLPASAPIPLDEVKAVPADNLVKEQILNLEYKILEQQCIVIDKRAETKVAQIEYEFCLKESSMRVEKCYQKINRFEKEFSLLSKKEQVLQKSEFVELKRRFCSEIITAKEEEFERAKQSYQHYRAMSADLEKAQNHLDDLNKNLNEIKL